MAELQSQEPAGSAHEREADWRRLEQPARPRSSAARRRGCRREELLEVPVLYRAALSSLSVARVDLARPGPDRATSRTSARGPTSSSTARAQAWASGSQRFFAHDWPAAVRALWRETLVAALLLLGAAVAAFGLVTAGSGLVLRPSSRTARPGRRPRSRRHRPRCLRDDPLCAGETQGLSVFATFLFTHNAQVAIFAFALGFALCLPTAALMAFNGAMLGAFLALFASPRPGLRADRLADDPRGDRALRRRPGGRGGAIDRLGRRLPRRAVLVWTPRSRGGPARGHRHGGRGGHAVGRRPAGRLRRAS